MIIDERDIETAWCPKEDCVGQRCEVHFQVMEGDNCRLGYKVSLYHNLSSTYRWIDREGQHDLGGYVEDVLDASTNEMGGVSSFG